MPPRKITSKRARGGASSSSSVARIEFDLTRFTSHENFEWYSKLKDNNMIVEKSIHPRIDQEVPLRAAFDRFGWGSLLDITGFYFPDLVWQFYANIEDKDKIGLGIIHTFVKGVRIEVSSDFLAQLLNVPNDGPPVEYNQYDTFTSDPTYSIHRGQTRLSYVRHRTGSRQSILSTSLPLLDRLICYFIGANIVPCKSSNNEVRNLDIYIVDKLLNGLGNVTAIPVATILIAHMRSVAHIDPTKNPKIHAPFAIIISQILAAVGVDLHGETSLLPTAKHVLNPAAMTSMFFIFRQGAWYRNPDNRNLIPNARDPPVPPPTAGEQAREAQVQEEAALDARAGPHVGSPPRQRVPRGTHRVFSAIFDCFDDLRSRLVRLEHYAATQSYVPDMHAQPFDRSALDDFDESDSTLDDE